MNEVYDLIGIGIGPFNLGLAALAEPIAGFRTVFLEQKKQFSWHEGLMIEGATLQVPFYADLVTLADPRSAYSFLNFLKAKNRMFRFACNENYYIERREYQQYCEWVVSNLDCLCFDQEVIAIDYNETESCYIVSAQSEDEKLTIYYGKHLVIGVGSVPSIPSFASGHLDTRTVLHSGNYLGHKNSLLNKKHITIVGSGQSAAEIFYDLLKQRPCYRFGLDWFTRSSGFYQMETSRLVCEFTSPDYIDYFFRLPAGVRSRLLKEQDHLYKGINRELIDAIYWELYAQSLYEEISSVRIMTNMQLNTINAAHSECLQLDWIQTQQQTTAQTETDAIILATGYQYKMPAFMKNLKSRVQLTGDEHYSIARNYSIDVNGSEIYVQNAEIATHGFSAPDLGLGPYRNMIIINAIMGVDHFRTERGTVFQTFSAASI